LEGKGLLLEEKGCIEQRTPAKKTTSCGILKKGGREKDSIVRKGKGLEGRPGGNRHFGAVKTGRGGEKSEAQ